MGSYINNHGGGGKTRVAFPGSTGKLSSEVRYFGYVSGKLPTYPFPNINTYFYARNMLSSEPLSAELQSIEFFRLVVT